MKLPVESERRKPGADGRPVRLADGRLWLLARATFRARPEGLTRPRVDEVVDRMFDQSVLGEGPGLAEVLSAARRLLRVNYELDDEELTALLTVAPGAEMRTLASEVVQSLFGPEQPEKTYTRWVRASLIAGGLGGAEIPAEDLPNVLAVLVATNRTVPLARFADACRLADERARLEALV